MKRGLPRPRTCDRREEDGDEGEEDVGGGHGVGRRRIGKSFAK